MTRWLIPPSELPIAAGEAHVWRKSLADFDQSLWAALSAEEVERARRFRFQRDRDRFVTGRAVLRQLLGRYLGAQPRELEFRYGARGKPELASNPSGICFNLAHSHDLALYAVTLNVAVGIDLELLRAGPAEERIPERFFSPREVEALRSLPEAGQREAFFRCWTRKEAFLKANGEGLAFGLDQFSVSVLPTEATRLLETPYNPDEAARWSLYDVEPGSSYVGALAVRARLDRVRFWQAGEQSR